MGRNLSSGRYFIFWASIRSLYITPHSHPNGFNWGHQCLWTLTPGNSMEVSNMKYIQSSMLSFFDRKSFPTYVWGLNLGKLRWWVPLKCSLTSKLSHAKAILPTKFLRHLPNKTSINFSAVRRHSIYRAILISFPPFSLSLSPSLSISNSVTRWPTHLEILGHLQQWKITQWHNIFAKEGSKFPQIL